MAQRESKKSVYFCTSCGYESGKWMGQCPSCGEWNTFAESESVTGRTAGGRTGTARRLRSRPVSLSDIGADKEERFDAGYAELNRVLGGGIVPGSLILVGGDPGVGKSTLLLQTAAYLSASGKKVLYVSGEESLRQIKLRADRIGDVPGSLKFLSETDIDAITAALEEDRPDLAVIDSIQTMYTAEAQSVPGSITQVRECAQRMMICCKQNNIASFLIGHVTKEGTVAGPRVLEHIVDTVLYFESGDQFGYRVLRSAKNRFGSTNEIGVFEMGRDGLKEVPNPSEYLLEGRPHGATGAAVTCLIEGSRPMLMEVQGLVAESQYGMARRQANGIDYNRLTMLLAVLTKRCGLNLNSMDAYVNIAGGMRVTQPSADLAAAAAVISSLRNVPIAEDTVIFGEIGLSGEVRSVPQAAERVKEARKLGFKRVIMPRQNLKGMEAFPDTELTGVRFVSEMLDMIK